MKIVFKRVILFHEELFNKRNFYDSAFIYGSRCRQYHHSYLYLMAIYSEDINPYDLSDVARAQRALQAGQIIIPRQGPRPPRQWAIPPNTTHEPQSQTDTTRRPA